MSAPLADLGVSSADFSVVPFPLPDTWFQALTLRERLAPELPPPAPIPPSLRAQAERSLASWRDRAHLQDDQLWAARLAHDGLDEETLMRLLVEAPEVLRARLPADPAWLHELQVTWFSHGQLPAADLRDGAGPGVALVQPLLRRAASELAAHLQTAAGRAPGLFASGADSIASDLLTVLENRLVGLSQRLVEAEFAAWRDPNGNEPAQRADFTRRLSDPQASWQLLEQYPLLGRLLLTVTIDGLRFVRQLIDRLAADLAQLSLHFADGQALGRLTGIRQLSETAMVGQAVMSVAFEGDRTVIYKPRSMAVDQHFHDLLGWLNAHGFSTPFYIPTILDRGTHGWAEFIPFEACDGMDAIPRYFSRQGGHAAALWLLDGGDIHLENVIARGEYPVLIDVEACFNLPEPAARDGRPPLMRESVLKSAILLDWVGGIPCGGLQAGDNSRNMPWAEDRRVDLPGHEGDVEAGFSEAMDLFIRHRDELIDRRGIIERCQHDRIRYLPRGVPLMQALRVDGLMPSALRDSLARESLFDRLWTISRGGTAVTNLFGSTRTALERGEVPVLITSPDSRDLGAGDGTRRADQLPEPGLNRVRRRVQRLSPADRRRETWIMRANLRGSLWRQMVAWLLAGGAGHLLRRIFLRN
jgi:lantibiotic modifying enzyme